LYWRNYVENYSNFKRDHIKICNHPDIENEEYIYLSQKMSTIEARSLITAGILTSTFLYFALKKSKRSIKSGINKLDTGREKKLIFGFSVIPFGTMVTYS
jgi:hypothetical protein